MATETPKGSVEKCTNPSEWEKKKEESLQKLVLVHFSAKWCNPCKLLEKAETLEILAGRNKNVSFVDVDVDILREAADEYKVDAMPTFVFIKDKKELLPRVVGNKKKELENTLKTYGERSSPT